MANQVIRSVGLLTGLMAAAAFGALNANQLIHKYGWEMLNRMVLNIPFEVTMAENATVEAKRTKNSPVYTGKISLQIES